MGYFDQQPTPRILSDEDIRALLGGGGAAQGAAPPPSDAYGRPTTMPPPDHVAAADEGQYGRPTGAAPEPRPPATSQTGAPPGQGNGDPYGVGQYPQMPQGPRPTPPQGYRRGTGILGLISNGKLESDYRQQKAAYDEANKPWIRYEDEAKAFHGKALAAEEAARGQYYQGAGRVPAGEELDRFVLKAFQSGDPAQIKVAQDALQALGKTRSTPRTQNPTDAEIIAHPDEYPPDVVKLVREKYGRESNPPENWYQPVNEGDASVQYSNRGNRRVTGGGPVQRPGAGATRAKIDPKVMAGIVANHTTPGEHPLTDSPTVDMEGVANEVNKYLEQTQGQSGGGAQGGAIGRAPRGVPDGPWTYKGKPVTVRGGVVYGK